MPWICRYGIVDCPECKRDGFRLRWQADAIASDDRVYFRIPYADKEQAKALGARWDADRKLWYAFNTNRNIVQIGRRWRAITVAQAPREQPTPPSPKSSVPDLFDVTAPVTEAPTAQPDPVPGSFSFDELMEALRAAEEADKILVQVEKKNAR